MGNVHSENDVKRRDNETHYNSQLERIKANERVRVFRLPEPVIELRYYTYQYLVEECSWSEQDAKKVCEKLWVKKGADSDCVEYLLKTVRSSYEKYGIVEDRNENRFFIRADTVKEPIKKIRGFLEKELESHPESVEEFATRKYMKKLWRYKVWVFDGRKKLF